MMFHYDGLRIDAAENARHSSIFRANPSDYYSDILHERLLTPTLL
jgi:1,4-alpha-glucan branching enzyme